MRDVLTGEFARSPEPRSRVWERLDHLLETGLFFPRYGVRTWIAGAAISLVGQRNEPRAFQAGLEPAPNYATKPP